MPEINLIAVVAAAVVSMVIGMFWYSPLAFGKMWMRLMGFEEKDKEKMKQDAKKAYPFAVLSSLVMAFVLAMFVDYAGAITVLQGVITGALIWLGFIATVTLQPVLWAGRSVKLYALDNGHNLIALVVMGAILAVWT